MTKGMASTNTRNLRTHADLTSGFGHDKSLTIRPYAQLPENQRPVMFYAGDGVSDLSAARETDLLFAKEGRGTFAFSRSQDTPFLIIK